MRSNLVYHIAINGEPYELKVTTPHKYFELIKCGTDDTISVTLPRFCTCQWPPCRTCGHIMSTLLDDAKNALHPFQGRTGHRLFYGVLTHAFASHPTASQGQA